MSREQTPRSGGMGGTFCQFTIGSRELGASARFLRYIANPQAVRDGKDGVWLKEFPPLLLEVPYAIMVQHLCQTAHWQEQREQIAQWGRSETQTLRTHYQVIVSFESFVSTMQAKQMLSAWMQEVFPKAQAAAFVHRNTAHLHHHVWIAARQTDGKKINLSARAFRQLDESWNRIYSQAMNRDEREHLLKKGQTERFKQLRREGKDKVLGIERPERAGDSFHPALFNERERERLGAAEKGAYDHHEERTGSHQPAVAEPTDPSTDRKRCLALRDPLLAASTQEQQRTVDAASQAVSEAHRVHWNAATVAEREPGQARAVELERGE